MSAPVCSWFNLAEGSLAEQLCRELQISLAQWLELGVGDQWDLLGWFLDEGDAPRVPIGDPEPARDLDDHHA